MQHYINLTEKNMSGKKRNYKKLSLIKSAAFLILAAVVLFLMKPDPGTTVDPSVNETTSAYIQQPATEPATETSSHSASINGTETTAPPVTTAAVSSPGNETKPAAEVTESGEYSDKVHVALYIHTFGKLPSNYITKTKAQKQGWKSSEGNLWDVLPGKSIGGGPFHNSEGVLPEKDGRQYKECDIDYDGGGRNAKRIVFSNDGLIYYTEDHYNTFELLYGEP